MIGAEAALSGCFRECRSTNALAGQPLFNANTAGEHKITNLFTVGPRLGYAWDRLMIFATGGWASANLKGQYCSTVTGICGSTSQTMRGSENGASRNDGWYSAAASTTWSTKDHWSMYSLVSNINTMMSAQKAPSVTAAVLFQPALTMT